MRFIYGALFLPNKNIDCRQCVHLNPLYYDTCEFSTCNKFNGRYADVCRMEGKCGKGGHYFLQKNETKNTKIFLD